MESWTDDQKLEYSRNINKEQSELYQLICKLFLIAIRRGLRMIVENPFTQPHYLTMYFPIRPKVIDKNRSERGDYYKKPTQYWFVNCEPENNLVFEPIEYVKTHVIKTVSAAEIGAKNRTVARSMISPQYANRFIREFILEAECDDEEAGIR